MARESGEPSSSGSGKRKMKQRLENPKSTIARCSETPKIKSTPKKKEKKQKKKKYYIGDTVDILDLLFTPQRDFLVKNNGNKVRMDDLKGKTIVLYVVPLDEKYLEPWRTLDMLEAYDELLPFGSVEFVFVAVQFDHRRPQRDISEEAYFNHLFCTMPWPAIPFSDRVSRDRIADTFSMVDPDIIDSPYWKIIDSPYWAIIDPTNTIVATEPSYWSLFNLYGGAELHPLTQDRLCMLWNERYEPKKQLNNLDQFLASPTRDYLLSSNGHKVPILSLHNKVIGLYFCENTRRPPRIKLIKKVYQEAKLRGYDFEIVQINFHFHHSDSSFVKVEDLSVQQSCKDIKWLTMPYKDPSCRKLHRIFKCEPDDYWLGDCLVIVDPRQPDINGVHFEFNGAEIIETYGIEGYPFTRQSLIETELRIQKESVKVELLFPPGECHLIRPAGDRIDLVDGSLLSGKRVLVLFAPHSKCTSKCVSMLKSKYYAQCQNLNEEENKFEVVYISSDIVESSFSECIKDMQWLVYPYSREFAEEWRNKIFKRFLHMGVELAVFDVDGELMAKDSWLNYNWKRKEYRKLPLPFISLDLKQEIRFDVENMCKLDRYYGSDDSDDDT